MRRILLSLSLLAVLALGLTGAMSPAEGRQDEGKGGPLLDITKVVDGDGPTGGYVIEYTCTWDGPPVTEALAFDAAGPGAPETQQVDVPNFSTCTVTETESNGADSVAYSCEFFPGSPASPPAEGQVEGCNDDQSASFQGTDDAAEITVTNTFEPEVLPDDDEPDPEPQPDVVDALPAFTG